MGKSKQKPSVLWLGSKNATGISLRAYKPEPGENDPEMVFDIDPHYFEWTPVRARKVGQWLIQWANWAERFRRLEGASRGKK